MARKPMFQEQMEWEDEEGEGPSDVGAESSFNIDFTAEDAAVTGVRDVVLPSNILSVIAGSSPHAAPGYGLLSSNNPALGVDYARDAFIPGPNSVDAGQDSLIEDPLDQGPTARYEEMQQMGEGKSKEDMDDTITILQLVGVIPAFLDLFEPRCDLHIKYPSGLGLKTGDIIYLQQLSHGQPSVAITHYEREEARLRGTLFTIIMISLHSGLERGEYLHWVLANVSDHSITDQDVHQGTEAVVYEPPSSNSMKGRHQYLFVAYSHPQPVRLTLNVKRLNFNLRSFATTYGLDSPVAVVYVTTAPEGNASLA